MKTIRIITILSITWTLTVINLLPLSATPLEPTFSYQGFLRQSGGPANGEFDLRFEVFDAEVAGSQIGPTLTREAITVSNGLFAVALSFGNEVLIDRALWIEVSVREGGASEPDDFVTLQPRQAFRHFSLNGKEAGLSTALTGLVTKTALNSTIVGSGTLFTQELSVNDSLLIQGEIFTVTSIQSDSLLEVDPLPESSALTVPALRDDTLFKVRAGDGQNKLLVKRDGVSIGEQGTPMSRIEHGTIGDCGAGTTGGSGTVDFDAPFQNPPRVLLTPLVSVSGCTSVRLFSVSESSFTWVAFVGGANVGCDCISWLAVGP